MAESKPTLIKIPDAIVKKVEQEASGICHGSVQLSIHIRNDKAVRYIISKEQSLLASDIEGGQQ